MADTNRETDGEEEIPAEPDAGETTNGSRDQDTGHSYIEEARSGTILDMAAWPSVRTSLLLLAPVYFVDRILAVTRWNLSQSLRIVPSVDFTKVLQVVVGSAVSLHPWTELLVGSIIAFYGTHALYVHLRAARQEEIRAGSRFQISTYAVLRQVFAALLVASAGPAIVVGLNGPGWGLLMIGITACLYALHAETDPHPVNIDWASRNIAIVDDQVRAGLSAAFSRRLRRHLAAWGAFIVFVLPWVFLSLALLSTKPWMPIVCVDLQQKIGSETSAQVYVVGSDSKAWTLLDTHTREVTLVPPASISFVPDARCSQPKAK